MNAIENKVATPPVTEELALVKEAKKDDDTAFEELVRSYERNDFRIAQQTNCFA